MQAAEHWTRRLGMTSEAFFVTDDRGRIKYWNEGAHRLMGYPEAEVLGKRCYSVLCGRHAGRAWCQADCGVRRSARRGVLPRHVNLEVRSSDGRRIPVAVSFIVQKERDGKVIAHLLQDASRQDELRQTLRRGPSASPGPRSEPFGTGSPERAAARSGAGAPGRGRPLGVDAPGNRRPAVPEGWRVHGRDRDPHRSQPFDGAQSHPARPEEAGPAHALAGRRGRFRARPALTLSPAAHRVAAQLVRPNQKTGAVDSLMRASHPENVSIARLRYANPGGGHPMGKKRSES